MRNLSVCCFLTTVLTAAALDVSAAESITEALVGGKAYGNFNLRYESVDQNNDLEDASALTLRSRLGYETAEFQSFSALIEFEDSRAGIDDYDDTLGSGTEYSVIADPESTELDQGYLQFKGGGTQSRFGRQVITYDNQRFVGHVGWRQDRQTFDAFTVGHKTANDLELQYSFIDKRNRIFADEKDIDAEDHLVNIGYSTAAGRLTGYAYLLEEDDDAGPGIDTYGIRFNGSAEIGSNKALYTAEFATQERSTSDSPDNDADYLNLEAGLVWGDITAKIGYEVLGSDSGGYGFATPLATLHKFNGWADQFLSTPDEGLTDLSLSVSGKLGGGKWAVIYHDFEADESSAEVDDLGDEIDLSYLRSFGKHYSAGIKFAAYSAGDAKVDTDKFWLWFSVNF
ncbi:MAG: alginate export family protein [bacterium]